MKTLIAALVVAAPLVAVSHAQANARLARITHYSLEGYMASGYWTYQGAAACSYDIPLGTEVIVDGDTYTCEDRGMLGDGSPYDWVDIWCPTSCGWVAGTYGDWADIEVVD